MKLLNLRIRQLPGLRNGLSLPERMGRGLVFVCGPNGIGKSSIIRAVRHLLLGTEMSNEISVSGMFVDGSEARFEADANGGPAVWKGGSPALPGETALGAHIISADLMAAATEVDSDLTREIMTQAAGGFDAAAVKAALPTAAQPQTANLEELRGNLTKAVSEQAALVSIEAGLSARREQLDQMRQEVALEMPMTHALQLAQTREELHLARAEKSRYDEPVRCMRDGDDQQLLRLQADVDGAERSVAEADQQIEDANEAIRKTGLTDATCPADAQVRSATASGDAAVRAAAALVEANTALDKARAGMDDAASTLGSTPDPTGAPPVTLAQLETAAVAWSEWRKAEARATAVEEAKGKVPVLDVPDPGTADRAKAALLRWLAAPPPAQPGTAGPGSTLLYALLVVAVVAAVVAVVLQQYVAVGAVIVSAGGVYLVLQARPRPMADANQALREQAQKEYGASGWTLTEWSVETIAAELDRITGAIAEQNGKAVARAALETVRTALDSTVSDNRRLRDEARQAWDRASEQTGLDIHDCNAAEICRWRAVIQYLEARANHDVAESRRAAAQETLDARLAEVVRLVETALPGTNHGILTGTDADAWAREIERQVAAYHSAVQNRDRASAARDKATDRLDLARKALQQFLTDRKVATASEFAEHWRSYEPAYKELHARIAELGRSVDGLTAKLGDHPDLQDLAISEARERLDAIRLTRKELDGDGDKDPGVAARIAADEERLKGAKRDGALAAAQQALAEAEAALQSRVMAYLRRQAQEKLVALAEEFAESRRPEVLKVANTTFVEITAGRYTMEIRGGKVVARDTMEQADRTAEELSTGTRMQMLLSVRLAFAETMSGGLKLPIFIDDALCMTDEARKREASEALATLVKGGRQVFYLSSDYTDHRYLESAVAQAGIPDQLSVLELPYRDGAPAPDFPPVQAQEGIAAPGEMDVAAYAEVLGVGPFDPCAPAGSIHILYAAHDDLPAVHRTAESGVTSVGQFATLYDGGLGGDLLTPGVARGVYTVLAFAQAWRALSDEVRDGDLDSLTGKRAQAVRLCADGVGWNGPAILECLSRRRAELDGIGQGAIDAIRAHFQVVQKQRIEGITVDRLLEQLSDAPGKERLRQGGALSAHVEWLYQCARATAAAG